MRQARLRLRGHLRYRPAWLSGLVDDNKYYSLARAAGAKQDVLLRQPNELGSTATTKRSLMASVVIRPTGDICSHRRSWVVSIVTSLATAPTTSIPGRAMPTQISWTLAFFFIVGHPSLVSPSLGLESGTVLGTYQRHTTRIESLQLCADSNAVTMQPVSVAPRAAIIQSHFSLDFAYT